MGVVVSFALLVALRVASRALRWPKGYSGLRTSMSMSMSNGDSELVDVKRVCIELGGGLREDGEVSLRGVTSLKGLRLVLLELADELLLDPEDDLGEWTLRYTDRDGQLRPVTTAVSIAELRSHARELRITARRG